MSRFRKFIYSVSLPPAIAIAKMAMSLSRLTGKGKGSSLPGLLALKMCPHILDVLAGQARRGVIVVTGTNGKTTTNNMIARILSEMGYKIVANLEGANLISGVATAFIKNTSFFGKISCDYACLEVDEAFFPSVCAYTRPDIVVVTNFFRDQLDRYWELDNTIKYIRKAIEKIPDVKLVLNADDPLVAQLQNSVKEKKALFFGLGEDVKRPGKEEQEIKEAKFCPSCNTPLNYEYYQYSQLGKYRCPQCLFGRPPADIEGRHVQLSEKITCMVRFPGGLSPLTLPVTGLYNVYNALAAFTTGLAIKIKPKDIIRILQDFVPATGRMQSYHYLGKTIMLNLVKNPAGFNESLRVLLEVENQFDGLIAINDNYADGRDISWLWDVDFEVLKNHPQINFIICSGTRAEEMGLRLKYAGFSPAKIIIEPDLNSAVDRVLCGPGRRACLLATYTALWPIEKKLSEICEAGKGAS
jgi:UDP-N-acetylmuramyl tripeptide synthase